MCWIFPRFVLIDIGGKQTTEIAALVKAEYGITTNTSNSAKPRVRRFSTVLLLVSAETPEVCERISIDADDTFLHFLRGRSRIIPIFCNVEDPSTVFTRATTLVNLADIHSIFVRSANGSHDLGEARKHIARDRERARSRRIASASTLALFGTIAVATAGYVWSLFPTPYYDVFIDADRGTVWFAGKESSIDKLGSVINDRKRDPTRKILITYSHGTTYDKTIQVIGKLRQENVSLLLVELSLKK